MTSLTLLIERIEAATEGSRELDGRIWCCINGYEFLGWDGAGCRYFAKQSGWISGDYIKEWTTSLDAVLTLLPDNSIADVATTGVAWVDVTGDPCLHTAKCATAPLALLAAILRARQAMQLEARCD